jgi:DNA-binding ferritin-like protein (Dps family)
MLGQNDINELQKAFYTLYQSLKKEYWASAPEAKGQIREAMDGVNNILDILDRADLIADNDSIADLTQGLKSSVSDLEDLQKQLDQIIHKVAVVTETIDAINEALTVAGRIVPLVTGAGI